MNSERTKIDHVAYPESLKALSFASLVWIARDAASALRAMPDGHKAGHYADEINYVANELYRRKIAMEFGNGGGNIATNKRDKGS